MGVNSIDTKINLNSTGFSNGLNKAGKDLDTVKTKLDGFSTSTLALAKSYEQLGHLQNMISDLMGGAYKYATSMETNTIGISAILKSMVNVNGKTLEWNQSLAMSKDLMAKLRVEALQTASTSTDLIDTFRGILGPALNQGMKLDEVMDFTKVGVNAVRSLGLPSNQYLQELRSILQGNIRPASSTLATALGITNQDVKNAKDNAGGVYKFLMDRMKGFELATKDTAQTVEGRIAIIKEGLYASIENAGQGLYRDYSDWLKEITDKMFEFNEITQRIELKKEFVDTVKEVLSDFRELADFGKTIFDGLVKNGTGIIKALENFALFKGTQWFSNSIFNIINENVERLGKIDNWLKSDEISTQKKFETVDKIFKTEQKQDQLQKDRIKILDEEIVKLQKIERLKTKQNEDTNKVNSFLSGNSTYSKTIKNAGINKGDSFDNAHIEQAKKMQIALAGQNIPLEKRNSLILKYISLLERGKTAEAELYGQTVISATYSVQALSKQVTEEEKLSMIRRLKILAQNTGNKKLIADTDKLINTIDKETNAMKKAGLEGTVAYKSLIEIIKSLNQGSLKLNENLQKQVELIVKNEKETRKFAGVTKGELLTGISGLIGAFGSLSFAYQTVTGDTETNIGKMAEWAIEGSIFIGAIESVVSALGTLKGAYDALSKSMLINRAIKMGGALMSAFGGPLALLALIGGGAYLNSQGQLNNKIFSGPNSSADVRKKYEEEQAKKLQAQQNQRDAEDFENPIHDRDGNLIIPEIPDLVPKGNVGLINPSSETDKGAKGIKKLKEEADEAKKSYQELIQTIRVANADKDESVTEFGKKREELTKKLLQWNDKLDTLKGKGGEYSQISDDDVTKAKTLIEQYKLLETEEINRNEKIKEYSNELQRIGNLETMGVLSKREANKLRVESLQEEIAFYQELANKEKLNADKRLEYETIIAEKRKALREAEATESKIQWDSVLEHIRNTSFNLTETFNNGIDGMIGRFTEFGQNIIGSTKSVTEQLKELCKNLTSDILNMMMKIYMQGLMMNLISNIFGAGGGAEKKAVSGAMGEFAGGTYYNATVFPHANGGVAKGWSLVGEKGPELVNFSNPGRVYTADQTRNALSGGGGVNVKIDLHNESGTQVEAQTTGSTFDGESYVVGVVLKAISTNKNGMRNIIKGVATT